MSISSKFLVKNADLNDTKKVLAFSFGQIYHLTITAPNDNAKSISVQCAPPADFQTFLRPCKPSAFPSYVWRLFHLWVRYATVLSIRQRKIWTYVRIPYYKYQYSKPEQNVSHNDSDSSNNSKLVFWKFQEMFCKVPRKFFVSP